MTLKPLFLGICDRYWHAGSWFPKGSCKSAGECFVSLYAHIFPGVPLELCEWWVLLQKYCQNRCGFYMGRKIARMQVAIYVDTAVYWVESPPPFFPFLPRYMINEITSSFWSQGGQYDNHSLTASNMLFLSVCALSKCVSLGDSPESQIFIFRVFLLISLILSEMSELAWGP